MPLRALFFDFDGLILDTETPEVEAWREIFREYGVEYPDAYWMAQIGRGADQIRERPEALLERFTGLTLDHDAIRTEYRRRAHARINLQPILPGVVDLAKEARASGLHVAVVSSSQHAWCDGHLARLGIADLFDRVVCRGDAARAKPFPDLYLFACVLFGIQSTEAIALEDSANGLTAANAAGIFSIAIPNSVTKHLDLSHAKAQFASVGKLSHVLLTTLAFDDPAK